jgi:hypothetical protein
MWSSPCRHRLPEQGGALCRSVQGRRRDADHHRRRCQTPGCAHRPHRRVAYLGVGVDPSSAPASCRARRGDRHRWQTMDLLPAGLLPARARALASVPSTVPGEARRGPPDRPSPLLRRSPPPCRRAGFCQFSPPFTQDRMDRLRQAPLRRARRGARLSQPLYPPRRRHRSAAKPFPSLPPLRRTHDHHRDLRAHIRATRAAATTARDENLMMAQPQNPNADHPFPRFPTGNGTVWPNPAPRRPSQRQPRTKSGEIAPDGLHLGATTSQVIAPSPLSLNPKSIARPSNPHRP